MLNERDITREYLLGLARRNAAAYTCIPSIRAIILTGSVAEGVCDFYSDLDMILYYDELPTEEQLAAARLNGAAERAWLLGDRAEGTIAEAYILHGVECQFGHATVAAWERDIAQVLEQHDVASPIQKALSGMAHCIPLHGEPLIRDWQRRLAAYPDGLAMAMVEHYLSFFPLWYHQDRFAVRDATIWMRQELAQSAYHILGVLAGLNRVYFSTFQFKRMRQFVGQLPLAPARLADRIEAMLGASLPQATIQLEALVGELVALVEQHMPEIDTSKVRRRLGQRAEPWAPAPEV
jgi:hypothetical protein